MPVCVWSEGVWLPLSGERCHGVQQDGDDRVVEVGSGGQRLHVHSGPLRLLLQSNQLL